MYMDPGGRQHYMLCKAGKARLGAMRAPNAHPLPMLSLPLLPPPSSYAPSYPTRARCSTRLCSHQPLTGPVPPFPTPQMQHPAVVLAFERQVLTASLPVAAIVQSLGIASVSDPGDVPYYLGTILCALYAAMGRPLVSSFHQGRSHKSIGGVGAPPPREATVQVGGGGWEVMVVVLGALVRMSIVKRVVPWVVVTLMGARAGGCGFKRASGMHQLPGIGVSEQLQAVESPACSSAGGAAGTAFSTAHGGDCCRCNDCR